MYKERTYRRWVRAGDLVFFEVREKETDIAISASKDMKAKALEAILTYRDELEKYIKKHKAFFTSLEPVDVRADAPAIVKAMADASKEAGVGPMAAVAGAVAEFVARDLLPFIDEIIVENGGDIFLKTNKTRTIGLYTGEKSPFSGKIGLEIGPSEKGLGVCTSSGTVSHSLSFGKSDASVIISDSAALADAAATAVGNILKTPDDITKAIDAGRSIAGVRGILVLIGDKMGSWGEVKLA